MKIIKVTSIDETQPNTNEQDDGDFYSTPRLVYHIDEGAVRSLTNYYKESES